MQGIEFTKTESGSVCCKIHSISEELKVAIRDRLSEVCNGAAKASRNPLLYSYKKTLKAFLHKYNAKTTDTKKGMIGELLTHVLFLHFETDFQAASPHFNMEEDAIKKGFDLVLHHRNTGEIWFVEVKSGECGENTCAQKLGNLLSVAKNDLKGNLNSERNTLWQNAVNGASIVLESSTLKTQIEDLLEEYNQKATKGESKSTDYNAVLVAVCYAGSKPFALDNEFEEKHTTQKALGEFKALMSISMQKDTYQGVADFLTQEVVDG